MDTVYGTKKYFQSLSGASDIYRTQACRAVSNDYTYQNTLGRRSQLGAYYHMNKQPSYTSEHNISSQYGYNSWGIWRDGRNIAPSTFSAKTHTHYQKNKSFSIILTTAAFIVLLAVISIAGLAFYFSSIKASMEDPILGFEGSFRIAKGDLFSTGLKYNHTTTYKQKVEFYKRFVEKSLSDNGLQTLRTIVWGFGDGPLIKVSFRIFLDVRKLPQNIHNVEEYIKESLFLGTTASKSLYRSLRLDAESVEIKRIIDEQIVNSAAILKEAHTVPTSQTQLEMRLTKKGGLVPTLQTKSTITSTAKPQKSIASHSADDEPDVDVENAPVIQGSFEGSFEITKTDADIARKKTNPTRAYHSSSTLPPKAVTPFSLRVKTKKPTIDKLTTILPSHRPKLSTSTSSSSTTTTTTTTTTTPATTTSTTTTTILPPTTTTSTTSTTTTTTSKPSTTRIPIIPSTPKPETTTTTTEQATIASSTIKVPKLDANLFTTIPILDTQPWRPIHREVPELLPGPPPAYPTKTLITSNVQQHQPDYSSTEIQQMPQRRTDEIELPFIPENPQPPIPPPFDTYAAGFFSNIIRKPENRNENETQQDVMFYHSFGSPVFIPGTDNIERLGTGASVQPHPLPVPLIDDVVIPPFKPLNPTLGTMEKLPFNIEAGNEKFEHLGGGVIVKKHENVSKEATTERPITEKVTATSANVMSTTKHETAFETESNIETKLPTIKPNESSELADSIGQFFMELLNLPKEDNSTQLKISTTTPDNEPLESRIIEEEESQVLEKQELESTVEPTTTTITTTTATATTTTTAAVGIPTTSKPNFLNLKEIILKRNQLANRTKVETNKKTTKPTLYQSASTESSLTPMKGNRIRPGTKRPPVILDDSNLFPSHSKWEFVNSSSSASHFSPSSNMRKVFNKTLQAWVSEDVENSENFTLNDIKSRINNATNIQDISLIFDTLASKLGITPSMPTKLPPISQNKLKQTLKSEQKMKLSTTTTIQPTTESTTTKNFIELQLQHREPFIKPISSFMSDSTEEGIGAAIPVVGEAEVEIIDPNKYEEMLKSSQFAEQITTESTNHKLVTLLPVRSNSGIRTYKPLLADTESEPRSQSSSKAVPNIRRKFGADSKRRFGQPPAEAVVKGGLKVTVK